MKSLTYRLDIENKGELTNKFMKVLTYDVTLTL